MFAMVAVNGLSVAKVFPICVGGVPSLSVSVKRHAQFIAHVCLIIASRVHKLSLCRWSSSHKKNMLHVLHTICVVHVVYEMNLKNEGTNIPQNVLLVKSEYKLFQSSAH